MIRLTALATLALIALTGLPAFAQGLFSPQIVVNDRVVTVYEYEQRLRMLQLFGAPGDIRAEALDGLVDDRLRKAAAAELGLRVTPEQVLAGMNEFAARANMTAEQFVAALNQAGVATETFRDFVEAGVLWREVVRARFLPVVQISDAEIDKALARIPARTPGVRVLLSELIIPVREGGEEAALALARRIRAGVTDEASFADAARRYSTSATAQRGGRLQWIGIDGLPPALAPQVLRLSPGQVTEPQAVPGAVALFFLRERDQITAAEAATPRVEYATLLLPNTGDAPAEVERIRNRVDTCDDLYPLARGPALDRLSRQTVALASLPADIAMEVARLDDNELSGALVRGGNRVLVMVCSRNPRGEDEVNREAIREQLINQRLGQLAEGYLADLRANAIIRER